MAVKVWARGAYAALLVAGCQAALDLDDYEVAAEAEPEREESAPGANADNDDPSPNVSDRCSAAGECDCDPGEAACAAATSSNVAGACSAGDVRQCQGTSGNCAAGQELCGPGSTWGECNVRPALTDNCDIPGDDADCDGTPNSGCPCVGGTPPRARDCRSSADNDCDGLPDNTLDGVCQCVPGAVEECDTHPGQDGRGICRAGSRTCVPSPGFLSSNWGPCAGSIDPRARNCTSRLDNDCDGLPDDTPDAICECQPGEVRFCGELPVPAAGLPDFNGCGTGSSSCNPGLDGASSAWSDCTCADDEFCRVPAGACDIPQLGACTLIEGNFCTAQFAPVCGCDGRTYSNGCVAFNSGMSVDFTGECAVGSSF